MDSDSETHSHSSPHSYSHSHCHNPSHGGLRSPPRAIFVALILTISMMVLELIAGMVANSLALLSDAAHLLTDVGALLLSLFAIWISKKPSTSTMSFGYHRAEILGALTSGLAIWLISGLLLYEAITRISHPPEIKGGLVFVVALVGLIVNLVSMKILHGSENAQKNINVRAAYLHLFTDSLASLGAVIAGALLWLTTWKWVDPLVTFLFSALMLFSSWNLVKETVSILMESTPSGINPDKVKKMLSEMAGVSEVHDLHIWAVSTGKPALSAHLISNDPNETLLNQANEMLESNFGIVHTTIQIENPRKFVSRRCYDCSPEENLEQPHKEV